jgi:hypothetical protein
MQCGFILILWLFFGLFTIILLTRRPLFFNRKKIFRQREMLVTGLIEFHKTQCFFASTIQCAALAYGLYSTNFLTVFLVIPLATNGIVPVVFGFLLIKRFGHSSVYLTTLTCITCLLSTLVYWSLYTHVIKVNWNYSEYDVYQSIMFILSSNDQCGGFSALTACPEDMVLGEDKIFRGADRIRFYTIGLWTWSTFVLFILVGRQIFDWFLKRPDDNAWGERARNMRRIARQDRAAIITSPLRALLSGDGIFWTTTLVFVAIMGLQLALLYISAGIEFFDGRNWSFGQIVAVAIWVPPLVEYLWVQLSKFCLRRILCAVFNTRTEGIEKSTEYRMAKSVKLFRSDDDSSHNGHSADNGYLPRIGESSQREVTALEDRKND